MNRKSDQLVTRLTEHLFEGAKALLGSEDEARVCERLLQAMWRQLVMLSGPRATVAIFSQTFLEASRKWPILRLVKVTDKGIDSSSLRQVCNPTDSEIVGLACRTAVSTCLSLIATLSGDSLILTLIRNVEGEMRGLTAASGEAERQELNSQDTSAA